MKNWDNLRLVLALHRFGSMVSAGEHLGVTDTTVARRIRAMSDDLGFEVFERIDNRWIVSERGRQVTDHAEQIEHLLEELQSGLKATSQDLSGVVRISSLSSIIETFLAAHVISFQQTYPGIELILNESDSRVSLANRDADIALRLAQPESGRLVARKVATFDIGIFQGCEGPVQDWVGLSPGLDWLPEMQMCFEEFGKPPRGRLCSYRGLAQSICGHPIAAPVPVDLAHGCQILKPFEGSSKTVSRPIWMAIHESRRTDPLLRLVMEWIVQCFDQRPSDMPANLQSHTG